MHSHRWSLTKKIWVIFHPKSKERDKKIILQRRKAFWTTDNYVHVLVIISGDSQYCKSNIFHYFILFFISQ